MHAPRVPENRPSPRSKAHAISGLRESLPRVINKLGATDMTGDSALKRLSAAVSGGSVPALQQATQSMQPGEAA